MRTKNRMFGEKTLAEAPIGYRFMRSFPLKELRKVEEPVPTSYSKKHASERYAAHYCYKPISRFRVMDLFQDR